MVSKFICTLSSFNFNYGCVAIKKRMEKDVDEVQKVSRLIKSKIEELDRDVRRFIFLEKLAILEMRQS